MAGSTVNIAGIILAAGTGSRMGGRTKQLLVFKGCPLVAHAVEKGLAAGFSPLILVLGYRAETIKKQMKAYSVSITFNPDYADGMATSLAAGLDRLDRDGPVKGAIFLLGDQPLVKVQTLAALRGAAQKSSGSILIPTFNGRRGNPVYFDRCFFKELKQLSGDRGGRVLIHRYPHAVREISVNDPGICLDIDTPEAYENLCRDKEMNHDTH